jgi:galactonate dehydratase
VIISEVKTYIVHSETKKNLLFVRLATKENIVGWGECYTQNDRAIPIRSHIEELARYVIGRDSLDVKHFNHIVYEDFANKRGSMDLYSAASGLELAMWDINGKAFGVPVYKLLGGKCRNKIRVYANGWFLNGSDEEIVNRAVKIVKEGFTALKFDPFPGPWRAYVGKEVEATGVRRIRAIRDAVGPDIDLLIECHRRFSPYHALRIAKKIESCNPFWFEEPVDCLKPEVLAYVNHRTDLAIGTGETLYTKEEFSTIFEKRAADIINPDVCACGGILALKEIAAMAEAYCVATSPHNFNSTTIGLAATVQVSAMLPNFFITEYFHNFAALGKKICKTPLNLRDGYIYLNDNIPGLGIELIEEELEQYPGKAFPLRNIGDIS